MYYSVSLENFNTHLLSKRLEGIFKIQIPFLILERRFLRSAPVVWIRPPPISVDSSLWCKIWIFKSCGNFFFRLQKKKEEKYTIILLAVIDSIFLMVREICPFDTAIGRAKLTVRSVELRYIANLTTSDPHILIPLEIWNRSRRAKLFKMKFRIGKKFRNCFPYDLKIYILPSWGKCTEMGGGQIWAASADLNDHLSGISDGIWIEKFLQSFWTRYVNETSLGSYTINTSNITTIRYRGV